MREEEKEGKSVREHNVQSCINNLCVRSTTVWQKTELHGVIPERFKQYNII